MDSDKSPKDSDESDGDDSDYLAGFDLDKEVEGYLENLQSIPIELLRPKDDEKPECNESKSKEEDEEETEPSLYSIVKSTLEANQTQEQDVKANTLEKIDSEEDDEDNLYRVTENTQLAKYTKDKKLALMKDDNSNSGLEAISDNDLAGDDIESGEYYSSEEEGALDKSDPQVVDMDISDGEANLDHKPVQRPANHMFDDIKTLSITVSNSLAYEKSLNTPNKKPISKEEYEKNKVILEEYYRKCDLYLKQMMKRKTDKKKKKSKNSKKLKSIVELPKGYTKSDHGAKLGLKKDKEKMKHIKERGRPSLKLPEKKRRSSHNKGKKSEHKYKLPEKINKKHKHYKKYVDYVKREYKKKHYEEKKNLKKVTKELEKQGLISQNGIHNIKKFTNSQKKDKFIPVLSFSDFCKSRELSPDVELQTVVSKPENEIEILDLDSRDSIFDTEAQNAPGPASNEDEGELFVTYSDLVKQNVFDNDPRMKGLSVFQQALFKIRPSKGIPFLQDDHQEVERVSPKKPNYTPTLAHAAIAAGKVDCDIMNKKKSIGTSTIPTPVSFHNKALSNIIGGALCSDKETLLAKSTTTSKLLSRSRSRSPNLYRRKSSLSGHSKSRSKSPTRSRTPPRAYRKRRVRSRSRTREKKRHKASSSPEFKHHLVYRPQRIRRSYSRSPSLEKWLPRSRSRSRSRPRYKPEPRSKHVERSRSRSRSISRSRYRKQAQARNRSRPRSKSRSRSRTRYRYRSPKVHRTPPPEPDRRYRRRSKSPFKSFADQLRSKLREENEKALAMLRKTIDQAAVTCKNAQAAAKVPSQESTSTRVSLDNPTQKYDKNSSVSKKYAIFKPSDLERLLPAEYSQFSSCGSPSSRSETSLSPKHRIPSPPPAALPSPKIPDVSVPPPCITAPPPPVPVPTTTVSVLEEQTEQIVVTTYTNYVPFVNPANPNLLQPTPPGTLTPYINPELSQYQYNNYMMPHTSIPPPHMFPPQMMGRFDQEMVMHPNVNQAHFPFMNQQQFHYPMGMPQFQNTAHPFPQTVANQSRNVSIVDISKQTVMTTGNIPQWSNDQTPVNETTSKPQLTWPQNLKQDQTIVIPQDASLKKDSILDQLNSGKTEQRFLNHLEGGTPPIDTSNFKSMCCVHSHFKPSSGFNLKNNPTGEVTEGRSNKTDNLSGTNRKRNESDDDCVIIIDTDKPVLKDVEEEEEGSRTSKTVTLGDLDDDRIKKGNKAEKIKENADKKIKLTLNFKPRPVKPIGLADVFDVANESDDGKISKVTESKIKIKNVCDLLNSSNIKNSDKSLQNSYLTQQSLPEIDKNHSLRNPPPKQSSILNKANEEINVNTKEKDDKHDVGEDIKINKNKLDAVKVNNDDKRNVNVEHETIQEVTEEINTGNISVTGQKENNTSLQNEDNKSEEVEKKNTDSLSVSIDLTEIEEIKPTNTSNGKNVEISETSSNDTNALPKTVSSNPSYKKKINLENKINKLIQVLSSSSTSSEDSKTEINNLVDNILADEQSKTIINKSMNESPQNSNEKSDGQAVDMTKLKNKKKDNSCASEKIQTFKEKTKDEHHAVLNVDIKINDKTQTVEKKRKDVTAVVNLDVGDKNKTVEKKRKVITAVIDLEVDEKTVEKKGKDTTTAVNLDVGDKNKTVEKKRKDITAVINLEVDEKTVEKKGKDTTTAVNLDVGDKNKTVEKKSKNVSAVVNLDDKNKVLEKKRKDVTPVINADVDSTVAVLNLEMDEKEGLKKISTRSKSKSKERKVDKGAKSKTPVTKSANTSDLSQLQNKTNSHSDEAEENSQSKHANKVKANTEEIERSDSVSNNGVLVLDQLNCSSLDEVEKDNKQSPINVSSKDSSVTAALQNRKPLKKNKDKVVNVGTDEVKSSKSSVRDTTNPEVQLSDDESSTTTRRTRGRNSKDTVKDTEENVRTSRGRSCKNKAESTTKSNTRLSRNNNNEADTENILEEISENKESTEMPKEMKSNKKGRKKKADETKLEESVIGAEINTIQQNTTGPSENESNTLGPLNVVGNDTTLYEDKGVSETPADSVNQEMNTVSQSSDCAESVFQSAQTKVKTNKKSKKGSTVQDKAKDSEKELLSLEVDVAKTTTESELSSVKPAGISGRDNGSSDILPETDVDADGGLAMQNSKNTRGRQKNKPPVKSDKKQAVKETTKNLSKSKIEDVSKTSAAGSTTVKINNYKDGAFPTNLNKKSKSEALQNTFYFPKDNDSAKSSGCNIDLPVEKPCPLSKKSLHYINMNFLVQRAAEEEEHRSVVKGLKLKTLQLKLTRIDDNPLTTISKASNKIGKKSVGRNKRKVSGNKHSKKILHVHNIIDSYAYSANTIRECDSHFSELEAEDFHPSYDESDNNAMSDIVICDVFSMSERQSEMMSQNIDLDDSCGLRTNFLFTHDDESNNCSIDKTVDSFTSLGKTAIRLKTGSDFGDVEEMIEQDRKMDKMETIPVRYNGCDEFPKGDSDEPKTNTDVIVTNIKCPLPKSENNSINDDVNICVEKSKDDEKKNIFQELGFTDFFSDQDEGDVISIKNSCEKIIETLEAKINDSVEKVDSVIVDNTSNVDKISDVSIKKTTGKKDCKDKSVINLSDCCDEKKDGNITNNKSSANSVPNVNLDCVNFKSNDSESSISSTIVNKNNIDSFPEKEKDVSVTNLSKLDSIFITEMQNKSENNITVGASSKQPEAVGNSDNSSAKSVDSNKCTTDHNSHEDTEKKKKNINEIMSLEDNKLASTSAVEDVQSVSPTTTGTANENKLMNNICKASIVDKSPIRDICENHQSVINILKSFRERPQPEQTEKKTTSLEVLQNETVINVVPLNVYLKVIEKQGKTKVNKVNVEENTEEPFAASSSAVEICGAGDMVVDNKLEEFAQNVINKQVSNSSEIISDKTQEKCNLENVVETESSREQCASAVEIINKNNVSGICKTNGNFQIDDSNSQTSSSKKDKESVSVDLLECVLPAFVLHKKKGKKKKSTKIETKVDLFSNLPATSTPQPIKNSLDMFNNEHDKSNSSISENLLFSSQKDTSLAVTNTEVSNQPTSGNEVNLTSGEVNSGAEKIIEDLSQNKSPVLIKKKGRKRKGKEVNQLTKIKVQSTELSSLLLETQTLDLQEEEFSKAPCQIFDRNEKTSITVTEPTDCLNALVTNSSELLNNEGLAVGSAESAVVFDGIKTGKKGRGRPKKIKPNNDKNAAGIDGTISYDNNEKQMEQLNIANGTIIDEDKIVNTKDSVKNDLQDDANSHLMKKQIIECRNVIGEDGCNVQSKKDMLEDLVTHKTEKNHTIDLGKNEIENTFTVKQTETGFVNHKTKSDKKVNADIVMDKNCTVDKRTKSNFVDELSVASEDAKCNVDERKINGKDQEEEKKVSDDWASNDIPSTLKRRRGRPKKSSIVPEATENIMKKLNLRTRSSSPKLSEPLSKVRRGRSLQNAVPKVDVLKNEVNPINDLQDDTWDSSNHYSDFDFRNDYSDSESQSSCKNPKVETRIAQVKPSSDVLTGEQDGDKSKMDVDNCFSFGMEFEELLQSEPLTGFGVFSKQTVSPQTKLVKPNSSTGTTSLPKKRGRPKRVVVNSDDSIELKNSVGSDKLFQLTSKDVSKVTSQNIEITSNSNFASELNTDSSHNEFDQSTDFEHLLEKEKLINLSSDDHPVTKPNDCPLRNSQKNVNVEKNTSNKETYGNIDEPLSNCLKSKKQRKSKSAKDSAIVLSETNLQTDPQTATSVQITDPNNTPKITRQSLKSKLSEESLGNVEIDKTKELKPTNTDNIQKDDMDIPTVTGDANVLEDNLCVDTTVSKSSNFNVTFSKNKTRKKKNELVKNSETRVTRQSNVLRDQQILPLEISQIVKDFLDSSEESSDVSHSGKRTEQKSSEIDSDVCSVSQTISKHQSNSDVVDSASAKLPAGIDEEDAGMKTQGSKMCNEICDSKTETLDSDASILDTSKRKSLRTSSPIVARTLRTLRSLQTSQQTTCEEDLVKDVDKSVAGVDDRNENVEINRLDAAVTVAANESIPIRKTRSGQVSKSNSRDSSPNIVKTAKKTKHCQEIPTCENQSIVAITATTTEIQDLSSGVDVQPSKTVCDLINVSSSVPKDQFQESKRRKCNKNVKDNDLLTENKILAPARATRSSKYSSPQTSDTVSTRSLQPRRKDVKNNSTTKELKDLNKSESTDSLLESSVTNDNDSTLSPVSTPVTELLTNPDEKSHSMKEDTPTGSPISQETLPKKRKKAKEGR